MSGVERLPLSEAAITADPRSIPLRTADRLVRGAGRYVADLLAGDALHVAFVRSEQAHGNIQRIDPSQALRVPGVHTVATAHEVAALGAGPLPVRWVTPDQRQTEVDLLAAERVRYVGEPVAAVVAETLEAAVQAAGLVEVSTQPLPPVVTVEHALAPDAPLLYPDWSTNIVATTGVAAGDPDGAFADAPIVVADRFHLGRVGCSPLEPRGAVARHDPLTGELTLLTSTQSPHHARTDLAAALRRSEGSIRIVPPDVGGSFGSKDHGSAPEAVLCALAERFGRPMRWIEGRGEHLAASGHSREQVFEVELAADRDGRVRGVRGRVLVDVGANCTAHGIGIGIYAASVLPGPYRLADYRLDVVGVVTNKAPSGAYRGYGAPEAAFVMEGLLDRLARRLDLDPVEVRRRNLLRPEEMPYRSAAGCDYDPADVPRLLDRALAAAGYADFRSAHPFGRRDDGPVREGIGVACCVLMGGFGPSAACAPFGMDYGGFETATVRMEADGQAVLLTGLPSQGQGLETTLAQVCAATLGIAPDDVLVIAGDTAVTPYSPVGPVASRGATVGGSAVRQAAARVADTLRRAACVELEVAPEDLTLAGGQVFVRGAPERSIPIAELARDVKRGRFVQHGVDGGLEAVAVFDPPDQTYSFAVHVARVRVDAQTGLVTVTQYATASDCGWLINPAIVRGQIHGGVVQGIGGALTEELAYAEDGQLVSASLMEYAVPTAFEAPPISVELAETPTARSATGGRGAGELGIIGPAAAVANAVADALGPAAAPPNRTPLTPERVWHLARADAAAG